MVVADDGASLLEVVRDRLGERSAKDGCSPQGQCGCCTMLVDGSPRVACVTPARRVAGRRVTTVAGLQPAERAAWADAFCATGASQCGFCTPGIIVRLSALAAGGVSQEPFERAGAVDRALLAHLCRCTGWRTIHEAFAAYIDAKEGPVGRDFAAAGRRAELEGAACQRIGPDVALGMGGFTEDTAPLDALVAVAAADGSWVLAETVSAARARAGKVQGRRSTLGLTWPLEVPEGPWARTLRTTWVEPGYLELDAAWCRPGEAPVGPLANGGAFGGKLDSSLPALARRLADETGRAVRVVLSREDAVRLGPKRPPVAAGIRADGSGVVRVVRTPGVAAAITRIAPGLAVEEVDGDAGPPTSRHLRAAGWAEAAVLLTSVTDRDEVRAANGSVAAAEVDDERVRVQVRCGDPLDVVALRSYCIGAAHMALGWVRSEGLAVDDEGTPVDLTIRSFGILRAIDTPAIDVEIEPDDAAPVNGSDAVFAAVAAAAWRKLGHPPQWPTTRAS